MSSIPLKYVREIRINGHAELALLRQHADDVSREYRGMHRDGERCFGVPIVIDDNAPPDALKVYWHDNRTPTLHYIREPVSGATGVPDMEW